MAHYSFLDATLEPRSPCLQFSVQITWNFLYLFIFCRCSLQFPCLSNKLSKTGAHSFFFCSSQMKRALNNSRMKNEWVKAVYRPTLTDTHAHTYIHTLTNALTQRLHSYLAVQIRASILWSAFSPAGLLQLAGDSCTNSAFPPSLTPSLFPPLLLLPSLPVTHS